MKKIGVKCALDGHFKTRRHALVFKKAQWSTCKSTTMGGAKSPPLISIEIPVWITRPSSQASPPFPLGDSPHLSCLMMRLLEVAFTRTPVLGNSGPHQQGYGNHILFIIFAQMKVKFKFWYREAVKSPSSKFNFLLQLCSPGRCFLFSRKHFYADFHVEGGPKFCHLVVFVGFASNESVP